MLLDCCRQWLSVLFQHHRPWCLMTVKDQQQQQQHTEKMISPSTSLGLKLDFKSLLAVEPTLAILQQQQQKLPSSFSSHLWLNADICIGPRGGPVTVDPHQFLRLCLHYEPDSIISIGWTTGLPAASETDKQAASVYYTQSMIDEMLNLCRLYELTRVTFPLRACYIRASWEQQTIQQLLAAHPHCTLTIWTNAADHMQSEDFLSIKQFLPHDRCFFDVPR